MLIRWPVLRQICLVLLLSGSLFACSSEPDYPGVGITIKNDIQDKDFNTINIEGGGVYAALSPGQRLNVPGGGAVNFTFRRRYSNHTKVYKVACPARTKRIRLKLIDVHLNRMAGSCKLTDFSQAG